jgi:hypothetical protein
MPKITLDAIAYARAGDKGDKVNIGVAARRPEFYPILCRALTTERIKAWFGELCRGKVDRYDLPNLDALNIVLHQALDGGSSRSLRIDNQGKALGDTLLFLDAEVSDGEMKRIQAFTAERRRS